MVYGWKPKRSWALCGGVTISGKSSGIQKPRGRGNKSNNMHENLERLRIGYDIIGSGGSQPGPESAAKSLARFVNQVFRSAAEKAKYINYDKTNNKRRY